MKNEEEKLVRKIDKENKKMWNLKLHSIENRVSKKLNKNVGRTKQKK